MAYIATLFVFMLLNGGNMQSPLSALCETLKLVKLSAKSYRGQLERNEAVTRAVLIDPVLRALGWEVANPADVEVERPIAAGTLAGRLDYFLNTENADKPIVIEAKKLGESLEKYFPQIVTYACTLKVENLFLTDGLKWFHFTDVSASSQKPPADIDLGKAEGSDLTKAAAFFVERLDAALYLPEPQKVEDVMQEKYNNLERKLLNMERMLMNIASVGGIVPPPDPELEPDKKWLPLEGSWDATNRKLTHLRLPNGEILDVRRWGQLLTETSKYCLTTAPELLEKMPIPDKAGRATKLLSYDKPPFASDTFVMGDKTIYVCTNYSANTAVANAAYMFNMLGNTQTKPAILLADQPDVNS